MLSLCLSPLLLPFVPVVPLVGPVAAAVVVSFPFPSYNDVLPQCEAILCAQLQTD